VSQRIIIIDRYEHPRDTHSRKAPRRPPIADEYPSPVVAPTLSASIGDFVSRKKKRDDT